MFELTYVHKRGNGAFVRLSWARTTDPLLVTIPAGAFYRASALGDTAIDLDIISGPATNIASSLARHSKVYKAATWDTLAVVEIRDSCGNLRHKGGDALALFADGPGDVRVDATLVDRGNGTYLALMFAEASGIYVINAVVGLPDIRTSPSSSLIPRSEIEPKFRAMHVVGSPWQAEFLPGAISRHTTSVGGPGLVAGVTAGILANLILYARDAAYNPVTAGVELSRFSATLVPMQGTAAGSLRPNEKIDANITGIDSGMLNTGQYRVEVLLHLAGTHQRWIMIDGAFISGMPQEIVCHPGQTSALRSELPDGPLQAAKAAAVGALTTSRQFIIQARDEYGNKLTSGGEVFRVLLRGIKTVYELGLLGTPASTNVKFPIMTSQNRV